MDNWKRASYDSCIDACMLNRLPILLLLVIVLDSQLSARVGEVNFSALVRMSNEVVLGRVVDVNTVKGVKLATVRVLKTYKGKSFDEILFLAQPTWTCDIAEAVKGETAVLFLTRYVGARKELEEAGITKPMFLISDSGRGRMPLRAIRGEKYATIWVNDVRLPTSVQTIPGAETKYQFIRSAPLNVIEDLIGSNTDAKRLLDSDDSISKSR